MENKRSGFSGKIGFVLAAAGSAVGLGNIWRFPYLAARYGGGLFLLIYIILAVTFGFALLCAELALGRRTGLSAVGAFAALSKRFAFIGYIASLVPILVLPYYSVIGGWVTKYFFDFLLGRGSEAAAEGYFDAFISSGFESTAWFFVFTAITALAVFSGVEKGVERLSKIMMPALIVLTVFIAVYCALMPGAAKGVMYYITPDFSHFSPTAVLAAMGQLFYSMSIAMGIMITYGSYMKKDVNLEASVRQIEIFDTGVAFLSGLMIIPAVFAFSGGDKAALGKGAGLMFLTLPRVFDSMRGGKAVGAVFFLMVLFAALTSAISLMETVVSIVRDKMGCKRRTACAAVLFGSAAAGLVSVFGYGIWSGVRILGMQLLDFFDFVSNSVLMPVAALLTCVFVGFVIKPELLCDEIELSSPFKRKRLFKIMIKYVAPVCILLILVSSVLDALGIFNI